MCNVYKQIVQKLSVPLDLSFLQNAYYQHFNSLCFVADSNRGPLACEAKEQSYNTLNDTAFRLTFAFVQVACKYAYTLSRYLFTLAQPECSSTQLQKDAFMNFIGDE